MWISPLCAQLVPWGFVSFDLMRFLQSYPRLFAFLGWICTCIGGLGILNWCMCVCMCKCFHVCVCVSSGGLLFISLRIHKHAGNISAWKCMHVLQSIPSLTCLASPLQMLNERHVMVRVGGGWETLISYLQKHDPCRGGPSRRSEVRICGDKAKLPSLNITSDSYMVVGAHYRGKK